MTRPMGCVDFAAIFDDPTPTEVRLLRRVCATCPFATRCYASAVADNQSTGFRAGTTERDRRRIRRLRRAA